MNHKTPWVWNIENKCPRNRGELFKRLQDEGFDITSDQSGKFVNAVTNFAGIGQLDNEIKQVFGRKRNEVKRFYEVAGATLFAYSVLSEDPSICMELLRRGCNGVSNVEHRRETTTYAPGFGVEEDPWRNRPETRLAIHQAAAEGYIDVIKELVERFGEWQLHVPHKGLTAIQSAFKYGAGNAALVILELDPSTLDDPFTADVPEVADRLRSLTSAREAHKVLQELDVELGIVRP